MAFDEKKEQPISGTISYADFEKVDVRCGTVIAVDDFPEAKRPAYKLTIDFGSEVGIRHSSVQIIANYKKEELVGRQVVGVVNFPPKKIGPFVSESLTLGIADENGNCVLLSPTKLAKIGARMY